MPSRSHARPRAKPTDACVSDDVVRDGFASPDLLKRLEELGVYHNLGHLLIVSEGIRTLRALRAASESDLELLRGRARQHYGIGAAAALSVLRDIATKGPVQQPPPLQEQQMPQQQLPQQPAPQQRKRQRRRQQNQQQQQLQQQQHVLQQKGTISKLVGTRQPPALLQQEELYDLQGDELVKKMSEIDELVRENSEALQVLNEVESAVSGNVRSAMNKSRRLIAEQRTVEVANVVAKALRAWNDISVGSNLLLIKLQDVFVVACAHGLPIEQLKAQKVKPCLLERFKVAWGSDLAQTAPQLWSRLGTSKYWLFSWPEKFSRRPRKASSRAVPERRVSIAADASAASTSSSHGTLGSGDQASVEAAARRDSPRPSGSDGGHGDQLSDSSSCEPEPEAVEVLPRSSTPPGSSSDVDDDHFDGNDPFDHQLESRHTFLHWDEQSAISREDSVAASSLHAQWPRGTSRVPELAARKRITDVLVDVQKELSLDFDVHTKTVIRGLVRLLPDRVGEEEPIGREQSIVRAWVMFSHRKRWVQGALSRYDSKDIVEAIDRLVDEHADSEPIVRLCVEALGARPLAEDQAVMIVARVATKFKHSSSMLKVCVESLTEIGTSRYMALGFTSDVHREGFAPSAINEVLKVADLASRPTEDEEEEGVPKHMVIELVAQVQQFHQVMHFAAGDEELKKVALDKVFWPTQWALSMSWCDNKIWADNRDYERGILTAKLPEQRIDEAQASAGVVDWVHQGLQGNYDRREQGRQRMVLAGLLFGPGIVVKILDRAVTELSEHFRAQEWTNSHDFTVLEIDITNALRALSELNCLITLEEGLTHQVIRRITDKDFTPGAPSLNSAWVGTLGTFVPELIKREGSFDGKAEEFVDDIIDQGNFWLNKWNSDGVVYESLWAANQLLDKLSTLTDERAKRCQAFADSVLQDDNLETQAENDDAVTSSNAHQALKEANGLKELAGQWLTYNAWHSEAPPQRPHRRRRNKMHKKREDFTYRAQ